MQFIPSLVDHPLLGVAFALTVAIFVGNLVALGYWARTEAAARDGSVLGTFVVSHLFVTRRRIDADSETVA